MGLSNAERQKRWREKRNDLAQDLLGTPNDICDAILRRLGVDQTKKVVRALESRLRNIKPDCPACKGSGFAPVDYRTECGILISQGMTECECGAPNPIARGLIRAARRSRRDRSTTLARQNVT